ncbi:MAG: bifunctional phosphoribosylaminoimidazolecarboxamide formyltransferase/IMP cyclohydrolase, partial [Candidatus Staskawiczbacteria bacterium]
MIKNESKTALISVFDKKGISKFAETLENSGYQIIASEGTRKELSKNKISCLSAEKISKNPKGLEDCIKTISFQIEAGILFDRLNPKHIKRAEKLGIEKIDIVVCNLVNFEAVIKKPA